MSTTFTATAKATDAEGHSGTKTSTFTVAAGTPALVIGMDFEPTAQAAFEAPARVARIYVALGQTDIHNEPEFVRAYGLGVRRFILSWKDSSVPTWFGTIPADVTWYGVAHHEPEEMAAAAWKALQAAHMPVVRAHGGIPTGIFESFSLNNPNNTGFHFADWVCPAGTHDALGTDFYPDKEPAFTQAQVVARYPAAMAQFGVSRLIVGEYGVVQGVSNAVSTIQAFKGLIAPLAEAATYWSNQASGKPNYKLTAATSAAWYS